MRRERDERDETPADEDDGDSEAIRECRIAIRRQEDSDKER